MYWPELNATIITNVVGYSWLLYTWIINSMSVWSKHNGLCQYQGGPSCRTILHLINTWEFLVGYVIGFWQQFVRLTWIRLVWLTDKTDDNVLMKCYQKDNVFVFWRANVIGRGPIDLPSCINIFFYGYCHQKDKMDLFVDIEHLIYFKVIPSAFC